MSSFLKDTVHFDFDRLFNGAVDVDWLLTDAKKAKLAATSFVFHGPSYHGVSQQDVVGAGHKLIDSASFFKTTIDNLTSETGYPFSLAIAGFGSGKSHMAVALAQLLETTDHKLQQSIIANLSNADNDISAHIADTISNISQKILVITINGMNNFDLAAEILSQLKKKFVQSGISSEGLDNLRKRFHNASSVLHNLDASSLAPLLAELDAKNKDDIIARLECFDESTYSRVHDYLASLGIPLIAIGDETVKDILKLLADKYIGEDKPFKKALIIFDEFGHYTEFATTHSQIAGNGALQHLFEGVQDNADKISFVGFIQYELKAYEQRLSSDYKNEIRRFITRFQAAEKFYLSINLETLIASLLIKNKTALNIPEDIVSNSFNSLHRWFPAAQNHTVWKNREMFNRVIAEGCWPLSPLAVWLLFHLSAGGQYLQQRSALSLLKNAFDANQQFSISSDVPFLPPVGLWTEDLLREFEEVEEQTGRRAIAQAYNSVIERSGQHLSDIEIKLLRSIVLIAQTKLKASDRADAIAAIKVFSGLDNDIFDQALRHLEEELNVITWDDSFLLFEILGDSVSKSQFLRFIKNKIAQEYDVERQSKLFIKYASRIPDYLNNINCDFAEDKSIMTTEWFYEARYTYWNLLHLTMTSCVKDLKDRSKFNAVDAARGLIVYCYADSSLNQESVLLDAKKILKTVIKDNGGISFPIIITLIFDQDEMGRILSEIDIIESMSDNDKDVYSRLAAGHLNKQFESLKEKIKLALLQRHYITMLSEDTLPSRLPKLGEFLFDKLYPKVLPFAFDGYKNSRTNAATDCIDFTRRLLFQKFTFDEVKAMHVRQKNRITAVLQTSWRVFQRDATVASLAGQVSARSIESEWDKLLYGNKELNCGSALELACASPYGANLASAGLLFAVYFQARRDMLTVVRGEDRIEFTAISDRLFDGTLLSTKELETIRLFKAESDNSEWERLLSDWGNAGSYEGLVEFAEKATELASRYSIPIPIRWKAQELNRRSTEARTKIEDADIRESKAISKIDTGEANVDIWSLSFGAAKLLECATAKRQDPMWRLEDMTPLFNRVENAKQFIIQHFESWLKSQRPASRATVALSEFRNNMLDQTGKNLKYLQLKELYEQMEKYVTTISRNFEVVADSQKAINDVDSWFATNTILPRDMTLSQVQVLLASVDKNKEILSKNKTLIKRLGYESLLTEIDQRLEKLAISAKQAAQKEKEIKVKAQAIWKTELNASTVESILDQIKDLEYIYSGSGSDIEDFRIMKNVLQMYLNLYHQFSSMQLKIDDFNSQIETAKGEFISRFTDTELPWDLDESFENMCAACKLTRHKASENWYNQISERLSSLESMSSQEADELLRAISTRPAYVDDKEYGHKLTKLQIRIEKYLESKGVEWLIEKFKQLSPGAKKIFLAQIAK